MIINYRLNVPHAFTNLIDLKNNNKRGFKDFYPKKQFLTRSDTSNYLNICFRQKR